MADNFSRLGMIDPLTGQSPRADWTEMVSPQEYTRRLEQGVPLREMAAHERYLAANPSKLRSLDEIMARQFMTPQTPNTSPLLPRAWPARTPPLRQF